MPMCVNQTISQIQTSFFIIYGSSGVRAQTGQDRYLKPLPFNQVELTDHFWRPRLQTQVKTLVPFALDKTIPAVQNLEKTARFRKGDTTDLPFPHRYVSSDLYKVMEGVAYLLQNESHPELEARMDHVSDIIDEAQQEDGYLYEAHITGVSKHHDWVSAERFMPGNLYHYIDGLKPTWTVSINGNPVRGQVEHGFLIVEREWQPGDVVILELPVSVRFSKSVEQVKANHGRVAVSRGPIVYAAEESDNSAPVQQFTLERVPEYQTITKETISGGILNGIVRIGIPTVRQAERSDGNMQPAKLTLIPYYAWNNRGNASMIVWLPVRNQP